MWLIISGVKIEKNEVLYKNICPEIAQKTAQKIAKQIAKQTAQKTAQKTYIAILANPHFSISELGKETGLSERTIKYHQKILKEAGLIERVGSDKKSFWKVLEITE